MRLAWFTKTKRMPEEAPPKLDEIMFDYEAFNGDRADCRYISNGAFTTITGELYNPSAYNITNVELLIHFRKLRESGRWSLVGCRRALVQVSIPPRESRPFAVEIDLDVSTIPGEKLLWDYSVENVDGYLNVSETTPIEVVSRLK